MAPRAVNYKAGSIVYFMDDKADSVFLLKDGKVKLSYSDIENGSEIVDVIATGEFFGVKSGLIRYPREETASILVDSTVIEFTTNEFEALITKNTNIILKMLKSFSNQLRRIHKQVQNIVGNKVSTNPSDDLFLIGDYYLKNKKYKQAITVYRRYLQYYATSRYAKLTNDRLRMAESALSSYGEGGGPTPILQDDTEDYTPPPIPEPIVKQPEVSINGSSEEEKIYYKGVSLMSQNKYVEAFNDFKKVLNMNNESVKMMASFEIGRCLFFVNKFNEAIQQMSMFLKKYPSYQDIGDVFFIMGSSYQKIGNKQNAMDFLKKAMSSAKQNDPLYRKVQKAMKELE
ncbi:MAG: hypothetical protein A2086_08565 [Spirochaetes bacterium GWD1_27_9]|nr:MAG: hypothetical protein A2Z98_02320 [Spirochaetes bacterium GWB1_27_13]OHD23318.1 MAG: hypothetical protein A2Y34_11640 [Spirochaetes bacterium GWC1_27_15]OHD44398.1 MAG: hypothetical protein A2086_08565 [Spirochaetes bacterium GWD1_27_9]